MSLVIFDTPGRREPALDLLTEDGEDVSCRTRSSRSRRASAPVQDEEQSVEQVAEERGSLFVRVFLGSATQPLEQPGDVIGDALELEARAYGLVEEPTLENVGGEHE